MRPDEPLQFLADNLTQQVGGEAVARELREKVNELEAKIAELEQEAPPQPRPLRRSGTTLGSRMVMSRSSVAGDREMLLYLMQQFDHEVELSDPLEEMPTPSLLKTLDKMRCKPTRASEKLGEVALRVNSQIHLPASPTPKQLSYVLKVVMQIDKCEVCCKPITLPELPSLPHPSLLRPSCFKIALDSTQSPTHSPTRFPT